MKTIPLSRGLLARVCDCHYDKVKDYKWSALAQGRYTITYRACRVDGGKMLLMHRFILNPPKGMVVDHINGDTMDNRCSNLRICTQSQNNLNQKRAKHNSKSGHKGVYWHKGANKWCAEVVFNKKKYYLGLFTNKLDAAGAYNKKARELSSEFFAKS